MFLLMNLQNHEDILWISTIVSYYNHRYDIENHEDMLRIKKLTINTTFWYFLHSYWTWPFIVRFPVKYADFSLPCGYPESWMVYGKISLFNENWGVALRLRSPSIPSYQLYILGEWIAKHQRLHCYTGYTLLGTSWVYGEFGLGFLSW